MVLDTDLKPEIRCRRGAASGAGGECHGAVPLPRNRRAPKRVVNKSILMTTGPHTWCYMLMFPRTSDHGEMVLAVGISNVRGESGVRCG